MARATSTTPRSPRRACATALDAPVALLDVDAHHGNGAQSIFAERTDVLTGSVHVDPAAGWFPHFLGHAAETCGGADRDLTLAPGSGDREWLAAVQRDGPLRRAGSTPARARRRARRGRGQAATGRARAR